MPLQGSYIRFEAAQPDQCWQSDSTYWTLANGVDVEFSTGSMTPSYTCTTLQRISASGRTRHVASFTEVVKPTS